MRHKLILLIGVMILAHCFLVVSASSEDYVPGWFESWDGNQTGILYNFWHSLNPFIPEKSEIDPYDNADVYGWYNGSFFGLANWEREICLMDLSTDVRSIRNVVEDTSLDETNIYTTTITIAATKQLGFNNSRLYEVSWYIMPYNNDAYYRVYLKNGDDKNYLAGRKGDKDEDWSLVTKMVGDSGYYAGYLEKDYEKAVLEYRDPGSSTVNEMVVSITDKVEG